MKPVHLHFGTQSSGQHGWPGARAATRGQRWLLAAALGLVGIACVVLAQRLWAMQTELAQSSAALQAASSRHTAVRGEDTVARPAMPTSERTAWARLAGALNTPWNSVFNTLEQAIPVNVALISIEPDATKATLRLEAEAATLDALLQGVRALGEADGIAQVALVKHETQEQHAGRPVRLVVELQLRRATQ